MGFGNEHDTTRQTDFGTPTNHALAKYDVIVCLVEVGGAIFVHYGGQKRKNVLTLLSSVYKACYRPCLWAHRLKGEIGVIALCMN